jgi:uncharacterized protein (DUF1697 family)
MPRYCAFLRGINVTGSRMTKEAMCEPFTDLGFEEVASFRASGNVVFTAGRTSVAKLEKQIEDEFRTRLGLNAITYIRTGAQLESLAEAEPFPAKAVAAAKGKLQVTFLTRKPSAAVQKQVLAMATDHDLLTFGDREVFWLPGGGFMDSTVDWNKVAKLTGPTTHRTMGVIREIYAKYFAN